MRQFVLPDLGEGLEEAEIVTWYVNEGDHVVTDQPLLSVETDKAVVEIPSPSGGRIAHLFGGKGDIVKVGAPLVEFAGAPNRTPAPLSANSAAADIRQRLESPPSDRPRSSLRCFRLCGHSRESSMSTLRASRPRDLAAQSHGPMSNGLRRVYPQPVPPNPFEACGARWPNAWQQLMHKLPPPL